MRIAHVTTVHRWDDGRIFERQACSLQREGHRVTILAPGTESLWSEGVEVLPLGSARHRTDRMWRLVNEAGRLLRQIEPDVVIVHDPELLRLVVSMSFRRKRPALVYDAHEDYSAQIRDKEWLPRRTRSGLASSLGALETTAARRTDAVLTATEAISRRFSGRRVLVVPNRPVRSNVLPLESRSGADPNASDRLWTVIYVGDLRAIRGARELVAAMGALAEDYSIRLRLVGRITPIGLEDELRRCAGWSNIDALGWRSRSEVYQELASADVAVLPFHNARNHIESEPNKLFEYLVMGLPIVMTDFPGWLASARRADAKFESCPPGDSAALASALRRAITTPETEARSDRAVRAQSLFTWESHTTEYTDFIASLAARPQE